MTNRTFIANGYYCNDLSICQVYSIKGIVFLQDRDMEKILEDETNAIIMSTFGKHIFKDN